MLSKRLVKEDDLVYKDSKLSEVTLKELCKIVVDDRGCYVGVLSVKDFENGIANNLITVEEACNKSATVFSEPIDNEVVQQILSVFSSTSLYYIPILSDTKKPTEFIIDANDKVITADTKFLEIMCRLKNSKQQLYVVSDNKLIGTIEDTELNNALLYTDVMSSTARDICKKDFIYTTYETFSDDIEGLLKFSSWPFIDAEGNLLYIMRRQALKNLQNWNDSQDFEINWWRQHLKKENSNPFHEWYNYEDLLPNDSGTHDILMNCWKDKTCLEIGAGPLCGFLPKMTEAERRVIIEPLADKYHLLRTELSISLPGIDEIEFYSKPADYFIPALENSIDGLIISCNALDHTPNWCFILSNISLYAQKGAYFYLWTDILHTIGEPIVHYNITPDANQFLRLVESFGFEVLYSEINENGGLRNNLCVTVFAIKR